MALMTAFRLTEWGKEGELVEMPRPVPGPRDVLLKVGGAGACQSDLHLMHEFDAATAPWAPGFVLGHENAGWITEVGAEVRRFREGQVIFRKGDPGEAIYFITDGRVKVISPDAHGQERVLAFLQEGAFFGEMALLTGDPRSTDVAAASDVSMLELRRDDFEERVASHPLVLKQMLRLLAERQSETNLRLLQRDDEAAHVADTRRARARSTGR